MTVSRDALLKTDTVYSALYTKVNGDMTELFSIAAELEAARDGESTLLDKIDAIDDAIAALTVGTGCPVSANDAVPGYLNGKLKAGEAIVLTELYDGADEDLYIACENASATNKGVMEIATSAETVSGTDTTRAVCSTGLIEMLRSKFLL
ncbi:MAG: hypothetical protein SVV67_08720 [Bacillota bacterium]|nr:hypothetical protein [Bacillota bacterium]